MTMRARHSDSFEDRYIANVRFADLDNCWEWTKSKNSKGYARIRFKRKYFYVHRLVLFELLGLEIPSGMVIDHLCRNPSCVRPSHLEVVSYAENTRRGVVCKISLDKAREMRALRAHGMTTISLGKQFGISSGEVSRICTGQRIKE